MTRVAVQDACVSLGQDADASYSIRHTPPTVLQIDLITDAYIFQESKPAVPVTDQNTLPVPLGGAVPST